jgi:flagellar basal body-associated protein FliL
VAALTEDFSAFGEKKDIKSCACDLTTDSITIHNTGDVTSTFMLFLEGEAAEWADIAPQTFYLEPGEVKQIERFIKVPCRARGEYVLNTTVRTLFDTEKVLGQTLNVENCPNIQIIPKFSGAQEECPCTPVQYSFEVVNTGNHIETYDISVEPYSEAIALSTDFLILEPGEKQEIAVFINLACGEYGEQVFTFNVMAQGTGLLGQTDFALDIKKCYDYELLVGEEFGVCQDIPNIIPFQIENQADIANEYFVFVEGEEWAFPENESIPAWGGELVDGNVLVFPPNEDESLHTIYLSTISARGEEERFKEILLETEKCYDYELIETENVFKAIECKAKEHIFVLKNIGSRDTTYYVDLEGLEWLTTSADPITLGPGEETDVILSGATPCESYGDYLENIYITLEEVNQTYLEEKTFSVYLKEEAYLPDIEISDLEIDYAGGETEVKITNTGFETATYDLSLVASDWISLDTSRVELAQGENATVMLQAWPTNDTMPDLYAGEFVARVVGEDIEYAVDFYVELKEDRGLPLWLIALIASGMILIVIIVLIVALLLGKKKKPKKEEKKEEKKSKKEAFAIDQKEYRRKKKEEKKTRIWPIILIIIIALLVAGGIYYAFTTGLVGGERNETLEEEGAVAEEPETAEQAVIPETPAPEETPTGVLTNAEIQESLITIDRGAVEGEGNTLELTNQTEINLPLSIKNPTDRKARFTVNTQDDSWVSFEREKITIMPDTTETINVKVTPDLEALEDNDYSIKINTTLEGKKIYYEETLDLVLTKQKPVLQNYWPWLLAGLIALLIIILIVRFTSKDKKERPKKKETKTAAATKPKKISKKEGKKDGVGWIPVVVGIIIILILAALGIWAYAAFGPEGTYAEKMQEESQKGDEQEVSETVETQAPAPETKLTEDDVEESLITIDRSGIEGEGDVFKLDQEQYVLPMTISNPTDRKARFTVNTGNESWIIFDQYTILIGPKAEKTVDMTLAPDMDALKENDYMISINTKLEGKRIDYEEELNFVVKGDKKFDAGYWLYALAGLILIGFIILVIELVKRKKGEKDIKPAKKSKKKSKKEKEKGMEQINKDLADLRKKTVVKLKKSSS